MVALTALGADAALKVWDTASGKLIHTFEGHLAGISAISWSPDGATVASGSDDKTIRLWSILTVSSALCHSIRMLIYLGQSTPRPFRRSPQLRLPNCFLAQR